MPSCVEDSDSSACIRPDVSATPSGHSSVFEKNPDFLWRHELGKTACNRLDARAILYGFALIRKRMKRIMERRLHNSPSGCRLEKSESVAI
jgi:hypothetical protein